MLKMYFRRAPWVCPFCAFTPGDRTSSSIDGRVLILAGMVAELALTIGSRKAERRLSNSSRNRNVNSLRPFKHENLSPQKIERDILHRDEGGPVTEATACTHQELGGADPSTMYDIEHSNQPLC